MLPRNSRRTGTSAREQTSELKREHARLEEEVIELRAAVEVWTEVCRRIMLVTACPEETAGGTR